MRHRAPYQNKYKNIFSTNKKKKKSNEITSSLRKSTNDVCIITRD